ncbi:MAG: hypothetical protein PHI58_00910 [Candidatus Omnitrophica bacterium]|nr:hypothetical protein [Candidatus Omnitrophota bacterium]
MKVKTVKIVALAGFLSLALTPQKTFAADQGETERMLRRITPPIAVIKEEIKPKDQWYVDYYYEPSVIIQGNRTGRWSENTTTFGYTHQNVQGYFYVTELDRIGNNDYNANWGSYITLKDAYVHMETGFGWNVNYTYNFQAIAEYGHKLVNNVFWQIGYNYRAYTVGDTHNIYPGLIYYFGNSYISANCGTSCIESRDAANFGTVRGSFAITDFLTLYGGVAFGERLYDIYALNAAKEKGYILFIGTSIKLYKGINCRAGYTYGAEEPKFQKHGVHYNVSVKF